MNQKQKLLITPTPSKKSGMYLSNLGRSLSDYYDVINFEKDYIKAPQELLKNILKADVFLLNWIENEPKKNHKIIRYLMIQIFFILSKLLQKKIVWTYHNLESHSGNNKLSLKLKEKLIEKSDLIIHHTRESECLTEKKKNFYFFHPFETITKNPQTTTFKYDILIWGNIAPYKKVAEFLKFVKNNKFLSTQKVLVAGKANNKNYRKKLVQSLGNNVEFHNKYYSDKELAELHHHSRFVLFSHQGTSVLNSGQLVVSLGYNSNIIGPNKGAFKELSEYGLIYSYKDFTEIADIIQNYQPIDRNKQETFIKEHSWNKFAHAFYNRLSTV